MNWLESEICQTEKTTPSSHKMAVIKLIAVRLWPFVCSFQTETTKQCRFVFQDFLETEITVVIRSLIMSRNQREGKSLMILFQVPSAVYLLFMYYYRVLCVAILSSAAIIYTVLLKNSECSTFMAFIDWMSLCNYKYVCYKSYFVANIFDKFELKYTENNHKGKIYICRVAYEI